jgi:hypothetical protein
MRQIDGAHTAPTQEAVKFVGADAPATGRIVLGGIRARLPGGQQVLLGLAGLEQRTDLGCELTVSMASGLNQRRSRFIGSRECFVEDGLDLPEAFCGLVHLHHATFSTMPGYMRR